MQPGRTHEAIGTHSAFMGNPMEATMKYNVSVYRTVQDRLRAFVAVEAASESEAIEMAMNQVENGDIEFAFHQCGDNVGADEYDAEMQP